MAYPWPGNVRELMHAIESAVILCRGRQLHVDLPDSVKEKNQVQKTLRELQYDHFREVLKTTNWKIEGPGGAAAILDINPNTLRSRMKKLGIRKKREK